MSPVDPRRPLLDPARPRATRPRVAALALALALGLGWGVAQADTIHLTDGGRYRGTIVRESSREVVVQTPAGEVKVPRHQIARIERDENAQAQLQRRLRDAERAGDAEAFHQLGLWCRQQGLEEEAEKAFRRAVSVDGWHRPSREALGHRYHQGRWYTPEEHRRLVDGLVEWEGRWVTPEERERLEQGFVRDENGHWVRPEDLARKAEEERLAREGRLGPPATSAPSTSAPTAGLPRGAGDRAPPAGAPAGGRPTPGRLDPPPPPAPDDEDKSWYRDNEAVGPFGQAPSLESRFYRIRTNARPEYAKRYGEMMDRYYVKFMKFFRDFVPAGAIPKSDIWIYASQREFMATEGMAEGVGGFYSTGTKRVTAFHGLFGMSGTTREVLAHEGTHQFQDIILRGGFGNAPIWILEGLAVFFESARIEGDEVVIGLVPRDRLAVLKRGLATGQLIPLTELIRTPQAQFTAYHYAHAWGLIYMIFYYGGSKAVRQRCQQWFADLFTAAKRGPVTPEMVEERCGGREKFLELEAKWKEWLGELSYDFVPG